MSKHILRTRPTEQMPQGYYISLPNTLLTHSKHFIRLSSNPSYDPKIERTDRNVRMRAVNNRPLQQPDRRGDSRLMKMASSSRKNAVKI